MNIDVNITDSLLIKLNQTTNFDSTDLTVFCSVCLNVYNCIKNSILSYCGHGIDIASYSNIYPLNYPTFGFNECETCQCIDNYNQTEFDVSFYDNSWQKCIPTPEPTVNPTYYPTKQPTKPTSAPTLPTMQPTTDPTTNPTNDPTTDPSIDPTADPTMEPTLDPTIDPTIEPTPNPTPKSGKVEDDTTTSSPLDNPNQNSLGIAN